MRERALTVCVLWDPPNTLHGRPQQGDGILLEGRVEICVAQEEAEVSEGVRDAVPDSKACLVDVALQKLENVHCALANTSAGLGRRGTMQSCTL